MGRLLLVIVALAGACALVYSTWALQRVSADVIMYDRSWPRNFPYPDPWLLAMNDAYDRRDPAPRGTIKLHGELDRVIATVQAIVAASATITAGAVLPLVWPFVRRYGGTSRRGFDVAPPGA